MLCRQMHPRRAQKWEPQKIPTEAFRREGKPNCSIAVWTLMQHYCGHGSTFVSLFITEMPTYTVPSYTSIMPSHHSQTFNDLLCAVDCDIFHLAGNYCFWCSKSSLSEIKPLLRATGLSSEYQIKVLSLIQDFNVSMNAHTAYFLLNRFIPFSTRFYFYGSGCFLLTWVSSFCGN